MKEAHLIFEVEKNQDCSGKQNKVPFTEFGENPGPGRLPLDSGRGDVEFASLCARSGLGGQFRVRTHMLEPCRETISKYVRVMAGKDNYLNK